MTPATGGIKSKRTQQQTKKSLAVFPIHPSPLTGPRVPGPFTVGREGRYAAAGRLQRGVSLTPGLPLLITRVTCVTSVSSCRVSRDWCPNDPHPSVKWLAKIIPPAGHVSRLGINLH